jgi:NTE family protein
VSERRPRIGLALGSGSFRGWAHIGVIRAIEALGVQIDVVAGCSVGALVGASYLEGRLDRLEAWALGLGALEFARLFDVDLRGGAFVDRARMRQVLVDRVCAAERRIETLDRPFAAVATDITSGKEVWFTEGVLIDAVQASMSLPGLFPPVRHENGWLVDGGLVNPVPVSICRALGADRVIAVNLNGGIAGRYWNGARSGSGNGGLVGSVRARLRDVTSRFGGEPDSGVESVAALPPPRSPGVFETIFGSVHIIQDRITRSRMAGDPPDLLITPRLSDVGLMDFQRARDCIDEGAASVRRIAPELHYVLGLEADTGDPDGDADAEAGRDEGGS